MDVQEEHEQVVFFALYLQGDQVQGDQDRLNLSTHVTDCYPVPQ